MIQNLKSADANHAALATIGYVLINCCRPVSESQPASGDPAEPA
jgi:hypothetical protein